MMSHVKGRAAPVVGCMSRKIPTVVKAVSVAVAALALAGCEPGTGGPGGFPQRKGRQQEEQ